MEAYPNIRVKANKTSIWQETISQNKHKFQIGMTPTEMFMNYDGEKIFSFDGSTTSIPQYVPSPTSIVDYIDFNKDVEIPEHKEGRLHWNDTDQTLELGLANGSILQIGQELEMLCINNTGVDIENGNAVYVSGASDDRPNISLANNGAVIPAMTVIGLTTQTIANGEQGLVTLTGIVRGIDTSAFAEGTLLFLGNSNGSITSTLPTSPNFKVVIGMCTKSDATDGEIMMYLNQIPKLSFLSDVNTNGVVADGSVLYWNSTNQSWEPADINAPEAWDDLRVPIEATTNNGSNPPVGSLFKNDGQVIIGTAHCLSFQSTSQGNLDIPDNVIYDTSADFTYEFWVRPVTNTQNNIELLRKQNAFEIDFSGTNQLRLNLIGGDTQTSSIQYNRGAWNHVAITYDASEQEVVMYLNNQVAITMSDTIADSNDDWQINRNETWFDIDYIAYWTHTLAPSYINTRYGNGLGEELTGSETFLYGLWELNDATGTNVADSSSTANDGTISGGTEGNEWEWGDGLVGNTSPNSKGVILKYFSNIIENEVYFSCQLPHAWKIGTDIHPHIHWVPESDGSVGERVDWGLEYTWSDIGDVFQDTTLITNNTSVYDETLIKNKHYITEYGIIDGTGHNLSSMLICRAFRNATSVDDTFPSFAGVLEIDFHYQIDSFGSAQEYIK